MLGNVKTPTSTTAGRAPSLLPTRIHRQQTMEIPTGALKPKSCALSQNGYGTFRETCTCMKISSTSQIVSGNMAMENPIGFETKPLLHEFKCNCKIISTLSSWWFQPSWKILLKINHFCKDQGENWTNPWNHHLALTSQTIFHSFQVMKTSIPWFRLRWHAWRKAHLGDKA